MDDMQRLSQHERETDMYERMVNGSERILKNSTKTVKYAIIGLVVAVVLSNLIWGVVYAYTVYKSYQDPMVIEASQTQEMSDMSQEQSVGGGS